MKMFRVYFQDGNREDYAEFKAADYGTAQEMFLADFGDAFPINDIIDLDECDVDIEMAEREYDEENSNV